MSIGKEWWNLALIFQDHSSALKTLSYSSFSESDPMIIIIFSSFGLHCRVDLFIWKISKSVYSRPGEINYHNEKEKEKEKK